jgi:hypothetical protein
MRPKLRPGDGPDPLAEMVGEQLPERRGGPVLIALTDRMEEVGLRPVLGFGRWSFPSERSVTGCDGGSRTATPGVAACVEEG